MNLNPEPRTQNRALSKTKSLSLEYSSNFCNTTKCLSKLQGWFWKILSTSELLSKQKALYDLPNFGLWNHSQISKVAWRYEPRLPSPVSSFSESNKLFQFFVKSSIGKELRRGKDYEGESKEERKEWCFPKTPHTKNDNQQALETHLVTQEKTMTNKQTLLQGRNRNFYCLREEGWNPTFLVTERQKIKRLSLDKDGWTSSANLQKWKIKR